MERPILFSTEMVKAILEGRKTQTRRILKIDYDFYKNRCIKIDNRGNNFWSIINKYNYMHVYQNLRCAYGKVGDILWVRETWLKQPNITSKMLVDGADTCDKYYYKASEDKNRLEQLISLGWKVKPSIHMPREACRIKLKITHIAISKLQNIGTFDLLREGMTSKLRDYDAELDLYNQYSQLWDKLNKERGYSWESNPFVWVISFEKVENNTIKEE